MKQPSDKSLWIHVQYLRELLDRRAVSALWWLDTRDMVADGLTKEAVDRKALDEIMKGMQTIQHPAEEWIAPDELPCIQAADQSSESRGSSSSSSSTLFTASQKQQVYIVDRLALSLSKWRLRI